MGAASDPMAVTDPQTRLHGIANLRIVDASIMPGIVNSNPHAAVIMIAEKASSMILAAKGETNVAHSTT